MSIHIECELFEHGQSIPRECTGDGLDRSPALTWSGLPAAARQLALIVDDPDAPTPEPWVHWVLYCLPAETTSLPAGVPREAHLAQPAGTVQGLNSWQQTGYRGPAPPKGHGRHRYFFRLYALDVVLKLPDDLNKQALLQAMHGHIVATGELMGTYER